MKVLFVHGGEKVKEDKDGNLYTTGSYNKEVWNRYLAFFNNISFIARKESIIYEPSLARQKFQFFDQNKIKLIEIPNITSSYSSFINVNNRRKTNDIIKKAVLEHDSLIVRLPSSAGYTAVKFAKKHNKPYLIEVVGCIWDVLWNHSYKGKILAFLSYYDMKKSVKDAPYVIYVTNKFLQGRYPTSGNTVGCSDVALPYIDEKILEERLNKIRQKEKDKPIILGTTAAVDVRYKGQENVIRAISKLNKEGYNFEYHLAGGGDNSYLKFIAEKFDVIDRIKFLGSIPHDKVYDYLDQIDIYIQPSIAEGLPRALIEALSRGCPSIGSDVGGIPELISSDFIFKSKEVNDLSVKLKKMDTDNLLKEAVRNFNKAREFEKDLLNKRRIEFYRTFKEGISCHD